MTKKKNTAVPTDAQPVKTKDKPKQKRRPRITSADFQLCQLALDELIAEEEQKAVNWAADHLMVNGMPFGGNYHDLQDYCKNQGVSIGSSVTLVKAEELKAKLNEYI